jgi:hypothetical protein
MKNAKFLLTIPVAVALVCAVQANISKAAKFQPLTKNALILDTVPKPDSPKKFVNYHILDTVPKPDSPKKLILH